MATPSSTSSDHVASTCPCYECCPEPSRFSTWEDPFDSESVKEYKGPSRRKRVNPWMTRVEPQTTFNDQPLLSEESKRGLQTQPASQRNSGYARIYSKYYHQPHDRLPPSITRTSPIAGKPMEQSYRRERVKRYKRPIDRPPSTWFFENVASNPRRAYIEGEEHFKCLWPSIKRTETIQTITRSMRGSLSGLVRHLEAHVPHVHPFYKELEERHRRKYPPRQMDYEIASRKRDWDDPEVVRYLEEEYGLMSEQDSDSEYESDIEVEPKLEKTRPKISYAHWEELIIKWFLATNKSFDHVEEPEFVELVKFLRKGDPDLTANMPTAASLARRYSLMQAQKDEQQMEVEH